MQQIILSVHVLSALLLWILSFHSLVFVKQINDEHVLQRKLKQLVLGIGMTSFLGLLTAFSYSSVAFVVCVKIGFYLSPAIIAIGSVKIRQRNLASDGSVSR